MNPITILKSALRAVREPRAVRVLLRAIRYLQHPDTYTTPRYNPRWTRNTVRVIGRV